MKEFLTLFKFQFRSQYGISLLKNNFKKGNKKSAKVIGIGLIITLALAQMVGLYTYILLQVFPASKILGAPELILAVGALLAGVFILIFGVFYILSGIFYAKDSEFLSTLPVHQESVFASKFALVMIGEYPFVLTILAPPVIIYGINMNCGILYYILALACGVVLPIIPLAIAALFALVLMNIVSRLKHRDLVVSIMGIIGFVAIFVGNNLIVSRFANKDVASSMSNIIESMKELISKIEQGFLPTKWITNILSGSGIDVLLNLIILLGVSAVALFIVIVLSRFIYQRGMRAQFESLKSASKKPLRFNASSPVVSVLKNEMKMILRTPIYALNSFAGWVMGPLVILMPTLTGALRNKDISILLTSINNRDKTYIFLIITGLLTFFGLVNPAASSAVSREGGGIWLLMSSPLQPRQYIFGKLLGDYFISFGAVVISGILLAVVSGLDFLTIFMPILAAAFISYPMAVSGMLVDVIRPKLVWANPQEVIKQNLNVVLGMFTALLVVGVVGTVAVLLAVFQAGYLLTVISIFALIALLSVILHNILMKTADRKFQGGI